MWMSLKCTAFMIWVFSLMFSCIMWTEMSLLHSSGSENNKITLNSCAKCFYLYICITLNTLHAGRRVKLTQWVIHAITSFCVQFLCICFLGFGDWVLSTIGGRPSISRGNMMAWLIHVEDCVHWTVWKNCLCNIWRSIRALLHLDTFHPEIQHIIKVSFVFSPSLISVCLFSYEKEWKFRFLFFERTL